MGGSGGCEPNENEREEQREPEPDSSKQSATGQQEQQNPELLTYPPAEMSAFFSIRGLHGEAQPQLGAGKDRLGLVEFLAEVCDGAAPMRRTQW